MRKAVLKTPIMALFKQKYVWLFFLGIFCYVSTEQGTSIFMSTFLEQYHGRKPASRRCAGSKLLLGINDGGVFGRHDTVKANRQ